jgi:hypothetical protein
MRSMPTPSLLGNRVMPGVKTLPPHHHFPPSDAMLALHVFDFKYSSRSAPARASEVISGTLPVQFASNLGDALQLGLLKTTVIVLRVISDIIPVRFSHCNRIFCDDKIPVKQVK